MKWLANSIRPFLKRSFWYISGIVAQILLFGTPKRTQTYVRLSCWYRPGKHSPTFSPTVGGAGSSDHRRLTSIPPCIMPVSSKMGASTGTVADAACEPVKAVVKGILNREGQPSLP
jgi:hypothetical protein